MTREPNVRLDLTPAQARMVNAGLALLEAEDHDGDGNGGWGVAVFVRVMARTRAKVHDAMSAAGVTP